MPANDARHGQSPAGPLSRPSASQPPATEEDTACCHAVQDKVWATGTGDEPREVYVIKGDTDTLDQAADSVCLAPAAETGDAAQPAAAACC